jgi:copper ion binding protein
MSLMNQTRRFRRWSGVSPTALTIVVFLSWVPASAPAAENGCQGRAVVTVKGMACPFCAYGLRKELLALPGVKDVQVNLDKSQAAIDLRGGSGVQESQIEQAVREAGFTPGQILCEASNKAAETPAFFKSAQFNVQGMRCENCAANITTALLHQNGVQSAAVDLGAKRAQVSYDPQKVSPAALTATIDHAGRFHATLETSSIGAPGSN